MPEFGSFEYELNKALECLWVGHWSYEMIAEYIRNYGNLLIEKAIAEHKALVEQRSLRDAN